jgi:hypothetical protein
MAPHAGCHVAAGDEEAGVHHNGAPATAGTRPVFWKQNLRDAVIGGWRSDAGPVVARRRVVWSSHLSRSQPLHQPHHFHETKSIGAAAGEERHILSYPPSIHTTSRYSSQQETSDHHSPQFTFRPNAARATHETSRAFRSHLGDAANCLPALTFFERSITTSRRLSAFRRTALPAL